MRCFDVSLLFEPYRQLVLPVISDTSNDEVGLYQNYYKHLMCDIHPTAGAISHILVQTDGETDNNENISLDTAPRLYLWHEALQLDIN